MFSKPAQKFECPDDPISYEQEDEFPDSFYNQDFLGLDEEEAQLEDE